jgi:hypothetical protein
MQAATALGSKLLVAMLLQPPGSSCNYLGGRRAGISLLLATLQSEVSYLLALLHRARSQRTGPWYQQWISRRGTGAGRRRRRRTWGGTFICRFPASPSLEGEAGIYCRRAGSRRRGTQHASRSSGMPAHLTLMASIPIRDPSPLFLSTSRIWTHEHSCAQGDMDT